MFIYNIKFDSKNIVKFALGLMAVLILILFIFSLYKIFTESFNVKDEIKSSEISYISPNNYCNILNTVYRNLDDYIGKKICFNGYIYRQIDFADNQFVLARDMVSNTSNKTAIVGFLCSSNTSIKYPDNTWVEIIGEIKKGYYNGEIPIIEIIEIKTIDEPENPFVPQPDDTYIETCVTF